MTAGPNGTGSGGGPTSGVGPSTSGSSGGSSAPSSPSATPSSGSPAPSSHPSVTPASSPAPSTPHVQPSPDAATVADGGAGESFDFGSLFEPPQDTAATPPAQPPAAPPAAPQAPVEAQPAAPVAPQASEAVTSPQGGSPPLDPADPAGIAANLLQHEAAVIDHVAQNMFALSPQEVEALEGDAVAAIPKLMAKAYVRSQHNLLQHLAKTVPLLIERHLKASQRSQDSEARFYSQWPGLKKAEHGEAVNRIAQTYRKLNPSASFEQMVKDVGATVSQMLGIPFQPAAPGTNGSRPSQLPPFQPASAVSGPAAIPTESGESGESWNWLAPGAEQ